jgi:hypothetical protein
MYRFEMNPLYRQATLQGILALFFLLLSFSGLLGRSIIGKAGFSWPPSPPLP